MDFSYVSHWRLVRQHDISGSRNHEQSYGAAITTINRKKPWLQLPNIDPEISDAASHNIMLGVVFRWYQGTFGGNLFDGENHGFAVFFNQSSEKFLTWQDLALSWAPRQKLKGFRRTRHDHQHVLLLLVQFWGCQPRSPRRIITSLIKTYNTWCMKTKTNGVWGGTSSGRPPKIHPLGIWLKYAYSSPTVGWWVCRFTNALSYATYHNPKQTTL